VCPDNAEHQAPDDWLKLPQQNGIGAQRTGEIKTETADSFQTNPSFFRNGNCTRTKTAGFARLLKPTAVFETSFPVFFGA
jgi:hypothetical protein